MENTFDLCEQLAKIDISEEETESLLKEANDLNEKLKAELRRMEEKEKHNVDKTSLNHQKNHVHKNLQKLSSATSNSGTYEKPKNSFLPPISSASTNRKKGVNKMKLQQSPYSSAVVPNSQASRSRVEPGSVLRYSSSAGNPSTSSSIAAVDQNHKIFSNASSSADNHKLSRVSTS